MQGLGGNIATVSANGREGETMRWFHYAADWDTGYGAPASPTCLLTIHNVCSNHAVLLGLTNIFQLVSFSAAEEGGDVEGPGGRSKLSSPSVRRVLLMSVPLFFLSLFHSPLLWQPAFSLQVLGSEKWTGNEWGETGGVLLLIPHFYSVSPVPRGPLPLQSYTKANQ